MGLDGFGPGLDVVPILGVQCYLILDNDFYLHNVISYNKLMTFTRKSLLRFATGDI